MSHSKEEERREHYQSFMDQIIELKHTLQDARTATEQGKLDVAKEILKDMRKRIDYTLKQY